MTRGDLPSSLDRFFARYVAAVASVTGGLPLVEHDPDEDSPCVAGPPVEGMAPWQPVRQGDELTRDAVEVALGHPAHEDFVTWVTRWWSMPLEALLGDVEVVLRVCATPDERRGYLADVARHLAHARRDGADATLPIAVVPGGPLLSIDPRTGEVVRHDARGARHVVAPSLARLLDALEPVAM